MKPKPKARPSAPLALVGTRVVVLRSPGAVGAVTEVRHQPFLKSYVVTLDDQTIVYCSEHDLALESDASRTPLAPAIEY